MITKIIYSFNLFLRLAFVYLENPFSLFGYLMGRGVLLKFQNGMRLLTAQPLDAIIVSETILDDSYGLGLIDRKITGDIIDVGAGLGDFSVFSSIQFPKAHIVSFEPNPRQYRLLLQNIKINRLKNVTALNLAVGTKKAYDLYIPGANVHTSTLPLNKNVKKIPVKGARLSSYIKGHTDLLKIDCEGAEIDVLKSIRPVQFRTIKKIVCEYHNHIVEGSSQKITAILSKYGYTISYVNNEIVPTTGYVVATR